MVDECNEDSPIARQEEAHYYTAACPSCEFVHDSRINMDGIIIRCECGTPFRVIGARVEWLMKTTRLAVAEKFVRDILRLMGQPLDAENPELVQRVALKVMKAMPERGPARRG